MKKGRICNEARSESIEACRNDMGTAERVEKTRQTSNEIQGGNQETSRNSKEQGQFGERS